MRRSSLILSAFVLLFGVGFFAGTTPAKADSVDIESPHLFIAPTVGVWRWDNESVFRLDMKDKAAPVYGLRVGYSPITALQGELVYLTGTNEVEGLDSGDPEVTLHQVELSFVVNFRNLFDARLYPFVNLGGGLSLRSSDATLNDELIFDGTKVSFHLGAGLKVDLSPKISARFNFRDTFYSETRSLGSQENQVVIDAVEFTAILEYRIPLGPGGKPERLR
ncbi:MAG: outer membrane beta-barrel protein [Candidatus Eisenbacteria bacterium]|uniref:Outer membrane beta-barrel protein n=1 Tax=Eiseniibacteriota bacterium TaxID=2212470 RepID=A0A7Y2EH81_UNCEI|nr:outer membrane beta-barrel protein [Candidatus Eisenbacteria bacterium]